MAAFARLNFDKCYKQLYLSSQFSDLTIKINNETIHAHKIVLSSRNKVFEGILKSINDVLEITDTDMQTFKVFLKYLYTDEVDNVDDKLIVNLLFLADKYLDSSLTFRCELKLLNIISSQNAVALLSTGLDYNLSTLKIETCKFIVKHFDEIKKSREFELVYSDPEIGLLVMEKFNKTVKSEF